MAKRTGRTLAEVYEQHDQNEQERQNYLKQLQKEEQRRDQERTEAASNQVIDEYRERRPSPPTGNEGREHSATAPDSRLWYLRNNPQAIPLVPLAPPQDLGTKPPDPILRGPNPATAKPDEGTSE